MFDQLNAISPLDGRYKDRLKNLSGFFSEAALIRTRIKVEVLWFLALADYGIREFKSMPEHIRVILLSWIDVISDQDILLVKKIEKTIKHDVKAVEYFLKQKAESSDIKFLINNKEFFHFGCTSEDINNLSYAFILKDTKELILLKHIEVVISKLGFFIQEIGFAPMLSRTHGQAASPTSLGKEIANFRARLRKARERFRGVKILAKMNGAVGNFNAHYVSAPEVNWPTLSSEFVESLGFDNNPMTTQIEPHDWIAEYCDALASINVILIDFCRDIWGYISLGYITQVKKNAEVGSSTMPHKVNPIDFENAEGNLGLSSSLLQHFSQKLPVSRFQRDLSDSTVLRNLGVAIGYSVLAMDSIIEGLNKLSSNSEYMAKDLKCSWEVLAEPIQMIMRVNGLDDPYEKLKSFSRGNVIDELMIKDFIRKLEICDADKTKLMNLKPEDYLGLAERLVKDELKKK
ncbi:MAG: adenylosuccinate lyase [Betaproteobacteria bacterium TMED82]|nr:MAG: adenylosuccinate lyase [Betaproteobacteria bacterium TMED82]|tara:strand:+ start:7817 stop:9196 length:1380 start_codon:yes stop_codon:yes gene_type:complete